LVYARLYRFSGERGECFPAVPTIAVEIGVGETQARTYLDELIDSGLIEKEGKSGKVNTYFFVWHECFDGVDGEPRKAPPRKTEGVENNDTPSENRGTDPLSKPRDTPSVNRGRRESLKEGHNEESHFTAQDLLRILGKTKGGKKPTVKDRAAVAEWIATVTEPGSDTEAAFDLYRVDPYWLEKGLPVRGFISQFQKYLKLARFSPADPEEEDPFESAPDVESNPTNPALKQPAAQIVSVKLLPDLAGRWNREVPAGSPVEVWNPDPKTVASYNAVLRDPQFQELLPKILAKCQEILSRAPGDGAFINFRYMLKSWPGILNGDCNWVLTKSSPKSSSGLPETPAIKAGREARESVARVKAERGPIAPISTYEELQAAIAKNRVIVSD
jgi:hypothetical protein